MPTILENNSHWPTIINPDLPWIGPTHPEIQVIISKEDDNDVIYIYQIDPITKLPIIPEGSDK